MIRTPYRFDCGARCDLHINFATDADQKETLTFLAKQLKQYAERTGDPKISNPHTGKILANLLG
jgi:hypothetical protein